MRLGIMQPYFLPYAGYFSLIKHVDMFILLDEVQYIRHGWIERNRILKQSEGWQYIRVPLIKHHRNTLIRDIRIDNETEWKKKIISQLIHYKKRAPYYSKVMDLLNEIFMKEFNDIVCLNKTTMKAVCNYLGIKTIIKVFSEMLLEIKPVNEPDEWALNICKAIEGVDEYWNPPGGISLFDHSKYEKEKIKLRFHSINLNKYDQRRIQFEAGMSIIDLMMFNGKEQILKMLDDYELL